MIDYFIISKKLVPFVRYICAVFETPWGPHFGLTLHAKPSEILQRILIKPSMPKGAIEMQKPKPLKKKPFIESKVERQKNRCEEAAKEMQEQQGNREQWENIFVNTPLVETNFSTRDPLQNSMSFLLERSPLSL